MTVTVNNRKCKNNRNINNNNATNNPAYEYYSSSPSLLPRPPLFLAAIGGLGTLEGRAETKDQGIVTIIGSSIIMSIIMEFIIIIIIIMSIIIMIIISSSSSSILIVNIICIMYTKRPGSMNGYSNISVRLSRKHTLMLLLLLLLLLLLPLLPLLSPLLGHDYYDISAA